MELDWGAVEAAGLLDGADDPDDRRALLQYLADEGLDLQDLVDAHGRGDLMRIAGERRMRPGARTFTLEEVATQVEVDPEVIGRVWRALGLVVPGPDVPVASPDDVDLTRLAQLTLGVFGEETGIALLRRIGSALERVTEAIAAAAIGAAPGISTLNSGSELVTAQVYAEMANLVPATGRLLDLALRHHIDAVRTLFEASGAGEAGRTWLRVGVGFADLSGFTSTTLALDLDELGSMVVAFEARAAEVVARLGGRVVKFVGDAALFVAPEPDALVEMAMALVVDDGSPSSLPTRVGLTFGTVLARDGDFFGPCVNLAARLVDVAGRHEVVGDDGLREAIDPARWVGEALPPATLRGIPDPVTPWRISPA